MANRSRVQPPEASISSGSINGEASHAIVANDLGFIDTASGENQAPQEI